MIDPQAGDALHLELKGRLDPTMSGDDEVCAVDQDRIGEAKALDAARDLFDLFSAMGAGIARVGPQHLRCQVFEGSSSTSACRLGGFVSGGFSRDVMLMRFGVHRAAPSSDPHAPERREA